MGQEPDVSSTPRHAERRRHPRCRLSERILIHRKDGSSYRATTCEISLSGLSAATTGILRPGEEVRLSPLVGDQVSAIVRRKIGTIYGFEFVSVPHGSGRPSRSMRRIGALSRPFGSSRHLKLRAELL
jgi:hypothetical protein